MNKQPLSLDHYPHRVSIPVRLDDYNFADHVDNTRFYVFFSEAIHSLLSAMQVDWENTPSIPYVAESHCRFLASIPFEANVTAGIGLSHMGNSSLKYAVALFMEGREEPVGEGYVVHVFVDRNTERPVPMPEVVRTMGAKFLLNA